MPQMARHISTGIALPISKTNPCVAVKNYTGGFFIRYSQTLSLFFLVVVLLFLLLQLLFLLAFDCPMGISAFGEAVPVSANSPSVLQYRVLVLFSLLLYTRCRTIHC